MRQKSLLPLLLLLVAPTLALAGDESKESKYLKNVTQLTHAKEGEKSGEPYFSPDGKRIIFQSVRAGAPYYQIYVMNADGSDQKMVSTGKGKTTCSYFHPSDPDRFIYASSHLDARTWAAPKEEKKGSYKWDYDDSFDIFQGSFKDPAKLVRLTDAKGYDAEGSYSHDGKKICFTSGRDGPNQIYVMDADGKNPVKISDSTVEKDGPIAMGGPFFMPGDEEVIYRGQKDGDPRAPMHVYVTNLKTKATRRLTRAPRMNWCPFPFPGGKKAIYAGGLGRGNFQLFFVKTDGSFKEVRLTWNEGFDGLPSFSPDGKKIVWTSTRVNKTSEVFVADFVEPAEDEYATQEETSPEHGAKPSVIKGGEHAAVIPGADHIEELGLLQDIRWLADPEREGRRAGTFGEREAASYVRTRFETLGVAPGGPDGRYEQPFTILAGAKLNDEKCRFAFLEHARGFQVEKDWRPLLYSGNGTVEGELVFCGYGIESKEHSYDDYLPVDVKGKIAIVFAHGPRSEKGGSFGATHPTLLEDLRFKVTLAKNHGAIAVLFVRPEGDSWLELGYGDPGVPVAQLGRGAFLDMFKAEGNDLDALRKEIDEKLEPRSRPLVWNGGAGKVPYTAHICVDIEKVTATSRNVIGRIEGTDRASRDVIVIGAHMDHLGWGGDGSLAPGVHAIHPGADDNASGTSGLLALARALKSYPLKHTVLLCAFGGEEMGLLGSNFLVKHFPISFDRVACMLNMDMIGRLGGAPLVVGGSGTAKEWPQVLEQAAKEAALDVAPSKDGFGPSDHASFYAKNVPVFFLFTGSHADYHRPTDTADKIDGPGIEKVTRFALALLRDVDALPSRPTFEKTGSDPHAQGGVVTGERGPYFGSVPDYSEGEDGSDGVKITGARPGSPADKAGLKGGDRIVEFDGKPIKNLYDYTYAIRGAKTGQKLKVVVLREGKKVELEAVLIER